MPPPDTFVLPHPSDRTDTLTLHYCRLFHQTFLALRGEEEAKRVLKAIEKIAAENRETPETVAGKLVEAGLRGSRASFPEKFVTETEKACAGAEPRWSVAGATESQHALVSLWRAQPATGYRQAARQH